MRLAAILVSLFPVVAARHHHMTLLKTILKPKGNFYTDINIQIQNIVNGVFDKLNLGTALHNKTRVKLLLTMHYDLKTVAERNYDVYETMKVAAKPDNKTDRSHTADKICEIITELNDNDILNNTEISSVGEAVQTTIESKYTNFRTENFTTPIFRDSKEFDEFVKGFVGKIDKLSVKDFYKGPALPEETAAPKPPTFQDDDDLNVWEPPEVLELDFVNDTNSRRIYHGKRTRIKKYPFMASVHIMGQFACGGSIIARDLVLSAASCLQLLYNNRFYRENPKSIFVRIGSDFYSGGGEKIDVVETYFHPSYDPKTLKHNLVILRMQKLVKFMQKQKKVKRILIDRNPTGLPTNTNGILILGWGARKHSHVVAPYQRLMVAQLDFYHIDECANIYSRHYVTDKHFCAGFISTGGGACNKDVGGPGIVGGILVGVVSFGAPTCGTVDAPTVFTKLGFYTRWIDSIIDQDNRPIGVRTTVRTKMHTEVTVDFTHTEKPVITPPTVEYTYRAREKTEKIELIKDALDELTKLNKSVHKDIIYGENTTTTYRTTTHSPPPLSSDGKRPMISKPNIFNLLPDTTTISTTPVPTPASPVFIPTAKFTETTSKIITNEEGLMVTTENSNTKPNSAATIILTIPTTPTIPIIKYDSDDFVTVIHEINKIDPKYYNSYEYKYGRTPEREGVIPTNHDFDKSLRNVLRGGTPLYLRHQTHQSDYKFVTPINRLKFTTERWYEYY